jgi:hypothetical protein
MPWNQQRRGHHSTCVPAAHTEGRGAAAPQRDPVFPTCPCRARPRPASRAAARGTLPRKRRATPDQKSTGTFLILGPVSVSTLLLFLVGFRQNFFHKFLGRISRGSFAKRALRLYQQVLLRLGLPPSLLFEKIAFYALRPVSPLVRDDARTWCPS